MVLRGNVPQDCVVEHDYVYVSNLITDIKSQSGLCIGSACYSESHVESAHKDEGTAA